MLRLCGEEDLCLILLGLGNKEDEYVAEFERLTFTVTRDNKLHEKVNEITKDRTLHVIPVGELRELLTLIRKEIIPFYTDEYIDGLTNESSRQHAVDLKTDGISNSIEVLEYIINNAKDSDLGKVVVDRISDVEKRLINFSQNLQVVLRAIETTFPGIVTDLRYELLKYVYDSARNFD